MGYHMLHDPENDRAVIYDSTAERALPHPAFIGNDALEQGQSFLGWLHARVYRDITANDIDARAAAGDRLPDLTDPRVYSDQGLEKVLGQWRADCWDSANEELNQYGWRLQEWLFSPRTDNPPARLAAAT